MASTAWSWRVVIGRGGPASDRPPAVASDLRFFRHFWRIVYLDAGIPDRSFKLSEAFVRRMVCGPCAVSSRPMDAMMKEETVCASASGRRTIHNCRFCPRVSTAAFKALRPFFSAVSRPSPPWLGLTTRLRNPSQRRIKQRMAIFLAHCRGFATISSAMQVSSVNRSQVRHETIRKKTKSQKPNTQKRKFSDGLARAGTLGSQDF